MPGFSLSPLDARRRHCRFWWLWSLPMVSGPPGAVYHSDMDVIACQINDVIRRWGDRMLAPLPGEEQLAAEWEWVLALLATDPPDYQAGRLRVARDRIGQARRMLIPQAVTGY